MQFLATEVIENPTLNSLDTLLHLQQSGNQYKDQLLPTAIEAIIAKYHNFQCGHCGYSANTHVWLCPSCHSWSTIAPKID